MDNNKESIKNLIAILQEQFLDTRFTLIETDKDLEEFKRTQEKLRADFEFAEDFWSQDYTDLL